MTSAMRSGPACAAIASLSCGRNRIAGPGVIVIEEVVEPLRFEPSAVLQRITARFFKAERDEDAGFVQLVRRRADLVLRAMQQ